MKIKVTNHDTISEYFEKEILDEVLTKEPNHKEFKIYSDYFAGIKKMDSNILSFYKTEVEHLKQQQGYSENVDWKTEIEGWYNIGLNGSYQEEHDHCGGMPPTTWSAIHYVKLDKEHEPAIFYNPIYQSFYSNTQPTNKLGLMPDMWKNRMVCPDIEEGEMIIFPSFVRHFVPVQKTEKIRLSIALNFKITDVDCLL